MRISQASGWKWQKSAYLWSVLFVVLVITGSALVEREDEGASLFSEARGAEWGFGGPLEGAGRTALQDSTGTIGSGDTLSAPAHHVPTDTNAIVTRDASLQGTTSPLSNILRERNGIIKYKIQKGDTLSEIAARFSISLETIQWANPGTRTLIRIGQELTIPPVSGILYEIQEGDSLESVASRYKIHPELVKEYNLDHQKLFEDPDAVVVLPYARPLKYTYRNTASSLPNIRNYFIIPARGWNWGELHHDNAIDIADECGSPIYASAEGLVVEESDDGFWNQGYGNYLLIEHPNGTKTKYAHTQENVISVGGYVDQGDKIALIGDSGKTYGASGCHLHFEVRGAQNPFAVR